MGQKRNKKWYDEEQGKRDMNIFNGGVHLDRAIALANLISANEPKRILELAGGGSILAEKVLESLPASTYYWTDFSDPALENARVRLKTSLNKKQAYVYAIDIDETYNQMTFSSYDAVVCVSLEHLEHDKEILKSIPPGMKVYFSIPNIDATDHIRVLSTDEQIKERYGEIIKIEKIEDCGKIFKLVVGVRS